MSAGNEELVARKDALFRLRYCIRVVLDTVGEGLGKLSTSLTSSMSHALGSTAQGKTCRNQLLGFGKGEVSHERLPGLRQARRRSACRKSSGKEEQSGALAEPRKAPHVQSPEVVSKHIGTAHFADQRL